MLSKMNKKFSKFEIAVLKRTAQNVNPMVTKKAKLLEKIAELQDEYNKLSVMQDKYEASIKEMTGGYSTEDLITKVVETSGKVKVTKYVLKYPETVIPVMDNNTESDVEEPNTEEDDVPVENETTDVFNL